MVKLKALLLTIFAIVLCLFNYEIQAQPANDTGTFTLSGSIISDACNMSTCHPPVTMSFDVIDEFGVKFNNGKSNEEKFGYYIITVLKPGRNYRFVINDNGFLKNEFPFSVPETDKYNELSKDFLVFPKIKDAKMSFHITPFNFKKSKIRIGADEYLEELLIFIKFNPQVIFEIESYPDNDISESDNLKLTFERCNVIKEYFTSKGIPPEKLTIQPNIKLDPYMPPPSFKYGKGKNYIGPTYLKIKEIL